MPNAETHKILVREKDYKALRKMQYSGGFKRFEMDIYDEGMKARHTLKDSSALSAFLSPIFNTRHNQTTPTP